MRLVCWNLRGGADEKWTRLLSLRPDAAVLPEAARAPKRLSAELFDPAPEWHWVGASAARGLAVASFAAPSVVLDAGPSGRWAVGARMAGVAVLGVWSCPRNGAYTREVLRAVESHERWLRRGPAVVAGDFNTAAGTGEAGQFARLAARLGALGLRSAYHAWFGEEFGAETRPTYYHYGRRERPFHIDYCFVSAALAERLTSVEVGGYDDWIGPGRSDHAPLSVEWQE